MLKKKVMLIPFRPFFLLAAYILTAQPVTGQRPSTPAQDTAKHFDIYCGLYKGPNIPYQGLVDARHLRIGLPDSVIKQGYRIVSFVTTTKHLNSSSDYIMFVEGDDLVPVLGELQKMKPGERVWFDATVQLPNGTLVEKGLALIVTAK